MRHSAEPGDYNRVAGLDANIRFGRTDWNSYYVRTASPGSTGGQYALRTSLNRESNFFHGKVGYLRIGEGFADDLGYYRRTGVQKVLMDVGVRPRPASFTARGIRELHPHGVWNIYTDLSGRSIGRNMHNGFTFFLNSGAFIEPSVNLRAERIETPLALSTRAPAVPAGSYSWTEYQFRYSGDASRPVSVTGILAMGGLWSGTQRTVGATLAIRPNYRLQLSIGAAGRRRISASGRARRSWPRSGRCGRTTRSRRTCSSTRSSSTTRIGGA